MINKYSLHCQEGCCLVTFDNVDEALRVFKRHPHPCVLVSPFTDEKNIKLWNHIQEFIAQERVLCNTLYEVLVMLSKEPLGKWYDGAEIGKGGYYAGWDDAEYAIRKALSAYTSHHTTPTAGGEG